MPFSGDIGLGHYAVVISRKTAREANLRFDRHVLQR